MNLKAWKEETFELLLNNGKFLKAGRGMLPRPKRFSWLSVAT